MTTMTDDELMTTRQAAEFLGSTINSLTSMRSAGDGPPWMRINDNYHVRYRKRDLIEYLVNRSPAGKSQAAFAAKKRAEMIKKLLQHEADGAQ